MVDYKKRKKKNQNKTKKKLIIAVQDFPALYNHTRKDFKIMKFEYQYQTFISHDSFSLCKKLRLHFEARFPAQNA